MQPNTISSLPAWLAVSVAAAAFAGGGVGGYAIYEHRMAQNAMVQQQQMSVELNQTRTQIDQLTSKLNALVARPEPQPAPAVETPVAHASAPIAYSQDRARVPSEQSDQSERTYP